MNELLIGILTAAIPAVLGYVIGRNQCEIERLVCEQRGGTDDNG